MPGPAILRAPPKSQLHLRGTGRDKGKEKHRRGGDRGGRTRERRGRDGRRRREQREREKRKGKGNLTHGQR